MRESRFEITTVPEMPNYENELGVDVEGGERRQSFAQWTR